jgi:hypothetical protein
MSGGQKSDAMAREIAGMTLAQLVALRDQVVTEIAARTRATDRAGDRA